MSLAISAIEKGCDVVPVLVSKPAILFALYRSATRGGLSPQSKAFFKTRMTAHESTVFRTNPDLPEKQKPQRLFAAIFTIVWRRLADLNRRITVLQTVALPLG